MNSFRYKTSIDDLVTRILNGQPIVNNYGVSTRQFYRYRTVAYKKIELLAKDIRHNQLDQAIARLNNLYVQAEKIRDKLAIQVEINKLLGLANSDKVVYVNMSENAIENKLRGVVINDMNETREHF